MPEDWSALVALKEELDEVTARAGQQLRQLEATRRRRDVVRGELLATMAAIRADGVTWAKIGGELGISAQAASQLFKRGASAQRG